ncbi:MAG: ABC transporter permease [Proteobacteria bacterium]|jgi:oligopeptide transport system permease protein|nr:ABC transporter permease [Pseudomonadota bacterium]
MLRRLASLPVVLVCVVTITFFLIRLSPGGPFDSERKLPAAIEKQLLAKYKLDGPIVTQYTSYLKDLLHGDLRLSTKYRNRSVNEILAQTLPVTLTLGVTALLIAITIGIWLGAFAAARPGTLAEFGALAVMLLAISLPSFVLGPLLILIFSIKLAWLPVGGWGTPAQLLLPSLTLALPYAAVIARLLHDSLRETLLEDFVRTARAKGLSERVVVYRHALRVAILPVVSYLGPLTANLLTGSIVVETIFHIPGAGGFFVNSILNRDGFLLGGVVIVYCVLLMLFNLLVDLSYRFLDRRIRA